jgi:flagellar basal-body rod modification protein FlgD
MTTVNGATSTTGTTDQVALGKTQLAQSMDTFLSLLTTQLKNQDPLSPMDSTQFTQQLVQMTGVEQQLASNDLLKQLVGNTNASVASAVGLIGKQVGASTADSLLANGKATWTYALPADAADVKIEVLDSNGKTVKTAAPDPTQNTAGNHSFSWDGVSDAGRMQNDGTYTLRITAKDSSGNALNATTFLNGVVTAVQEINGQAAVTVNGLWVPLSGVTAITNAPAANADGSGASTTSQDGQTSSPAA